jgi:hypothetical protein
MLIFQNPLPEIGNLCNLPHVTQTNREVVLVEACAVCTHSRTEHFRGRLDCLYAIEEQAACRCAEFVELPLPATGQWDASTAGGEQCWPAHAARWRHQPTGSRRSGVCSSRRAAQSSSPASRLHRVLADMRWCSAAGATHRLTTLLPLRGYGLSCVPIANGCNGFRRTLAQSADAAHSWAPAGSPLATPPGASPRHR